MELKIYKCGEYENYYNEISEMLYDGDDEFVPPLSSRKSTIQTNLKSAEKSSIFQHIFNLLRCKGINCVAELALHRKRLAFCADFAQFLPA